MRYCGSSWPIEGDNGRRMTIATSTRARSTSSAVGRPGRARRPPAPRGEGRRVRRSDLPARRARRTVPGSPAERVRSSAAGPRPRSRPSAKPASGAMQPERVVGQDGESSGGDQHQGDGPDHQHPHQSYRAGRCGQRRGPRRTPRRRRPKSPPGASGLSPELKPSWTVR